MELLFNYNAKELQSSGALITAREIRQQPRLWKEAYDYLKAEKKTIAAFMEEIMKLQGIRIILTGAGSSAFAGECIAPYLTEKLSKTVEAIATTDIVSNPLNFLIPETPTLLISFARSGNSPESIAALNIADKVLQNVYHIILTCNSEGELAKRCGNHRNCLLLLMPELSNDKGFAMTGSFTCMTLSALLFFDIANIEKYQDTINGICEVGDRFLEEGYRQIANIAAGEFKRLIYLGSGCLRGLARESALKMLELSGGKVMTGFDSTLAFRHGPKSAIDDSTIIVSYLSNDAYTRQYDMDLIKEIHREKSDYVIIAVSGRNDESVVSFADEAIFLNQNRENDKDDVFSIFNFILVAQTMAFLKSIKLGISPDNPSPSGTVNRVVQGVNIYQFPYQH